MKIIISVIALVICLIIAGKIFNFFNPWAAFAFLGVVAYLFIKYIKKQIDEKF